MTAAGPVLPRRRLQPGRPRLPVAGDWNGDGADEPAVYHTGTLMRRRERATAASNEEIASQLGCSLGSLERKLWVIRKKWTHEPSTLECGDS
jgi:hypothetical protein